MNNKLIYSCSNHIDMIIEEWINDYELAPEIDLLNKTVDIPCSWCEDKAIYCIIQTEAECEEENS